MAFVFWTIIKKIRHEVKNFKS